MQSMTTELQNREICFYGNNAQVTYDKTKTSMLGNLIPRLDNKTNNTKIGPKVG